MISIRLIKESKSCSQVIAISIAAIVLSKEEKILYDIYNNQIKVQPHLV